MTKDYISENPYDLNSKWRAYPGIWSLHMNPQLMNLIAYPVPLELQFRQGVPRIGGQNCMCHSPEWSAATGYTGASQKITLIKTLVAVTLGEQHLTQRACACDHDRKLDLVCWRISGTFSFQTQSRSAAAGNSWGLAWRPQNVQNIVDSTSFYKSLLGKSLPEKVKTGQARGAQRITSLKIPTILTQSGGHISTEVFSMHAMIRFPLPFCRGGDIKFQAQWCTAAAGNLPQKFYFNDKMLVFSSLAELVRLRQSWMIPHCARLARKLFCFWACCIQLEVSDSAKDKVVQRYY